MNRSHVMWLLGGVVLGIVFSQQITKLPLVNKIPQV
jgi:hypothetical protein